MKIWEALQQLKDDVDRGVPPTRGICGGMSTNALTQKQVHVWLNSRKWVFRSWPEFSGNLFYPVPSRSHVIIAYDVAETRKSLWNLQTEYGAARYRLLEHMIEVYKELDL